MKGYLPAKQVAPPPPISNQNGFTAELNRINESEVEEVDEHLVRIFVYNNANTVSANIPYDQQ